MTRPKVAIIGAGQVGATTAWNLARTNLADIALVDIVEGLAQGKALDMMHASALEHLTVTVEGSTDYAAIRESRIVVVTAGLARKPGMTREDLLKANAEIVRPIVEQVVRHAPQAILIMVTNPLDVMTYLAYTATGWERSRVLGMAGVLDGARFAYGIAQRLGVAPDQVAPMVLGTHGDTMVCLPRHTTVNGKRLTDLLPPDDVAALVQRTRDAGAEIVALLKAGSAFYAPGSSVVAMVRAILQNAQTAMTASAILTGEYGCHGIALGVPVRLGATGLAEIIQIDLTSEERQALQAAAATVQSGLQALGLVGAKKS
ncbi:MAG: malate dehydrogenase [Candidatus Omnitrophica bacterium]|nr:malate dehydrogenase [Candidatus Omnitrophota bacterium]